MRNEDRMRALVGEVLETMSSATEPFVADVLRDAVPGITDWTSIVREKDRAAGHPERRYNSGDIAVQLRAITERLGAIGFPFRDRFSPAQYAMFSILREARNQHAHYEPFDAADAYRVADAAARLLRVIECQDASEQVSSLGRQALREIAEREEPELERAVSNGVGVDGVVPREDGGNDAGSGTAGVDAVRGLEIIVHAQDFLSYALARAGVSVVSGIEIRSSGAAVRGASIEVVVESEFGRLNEPATIFADIGSGETTHLRALDIKLDPVRMLTVDTQATAVIQVTVKDAERTTRAVERVATHLLAADEWIARPVVLGLELLAAFVQPQARAIERLLPDVSDRLEAATGSGSLDGYQSASSERVDAIVKATFEAIAARDIHYAEPPASWGLAGQRVRTPGDVLDGRLGTCLDLTVVLAAALEQMGVHTVLLLREGHIFLGYWREEATLDVPAQVEVAEAVNLVDLGQIGVVEPTLIAGTSQGTTFAEAMHHAQRQISNPDSDFVGVTDVVQARRSRILPLPSRDTTGDGETEIREYEVHAGRSVSEVLSERVQSGLPGSPDAVPPRVLAWKNALLDLSLRNRLINFTPNAGFELTVPGPMLPHVEDRLHAGRTIELLPSDAMPSIEQQRGLTYARDLPDNVRSDLLVERGRVHIDGLTDATYTSRLRKLANTARTIVEETGANNLYLACGMLRWELDGRELRSPLILVPIKLTSIGKGQRFRVAIDESGESTPNFCLLEKLLATKQLSIPGLASPVRDDAGIDLRMALDATRRAVLEARLPFTVEATSHIAILQFAKYRLWKDLDDSWSELAKNTLISHLIDTPTDAFDGAAPSGALPDLDELALDVPVAGDASQLRAVAEAVEGGTFVLEGPPGTGKSQTITNLIANAIREGKKVLFVAEKRAALDVVKKRLESVGLGPFSLDLHDKGARPNAVRAQISESLDLVRGADQAALMSAEEIARSSRNTLARYAARLHDPNGAGYSLYTARGRVLLSEDVPVLPVPTQLVEEGQQVTRDRVEATLRHLPETADAARPAKDHAWGFIDHVHEAFDSAAVAQCAADLDAATDSLVDRGHADLAHLMSGVRSIDLWAGLARAPRFDLAAVDQLRVSGQSQRIPALRQQIENLATRLPAWRSSVDPAVIEDDLATVRQAAAAADASNLFGRRGRRETAMSGMSTRLLAPLNQLRKQPIAPLVDEIIRFQHEVWSVRQALNDVALRARAATWSPFDESSTSQTLSDLRWIEWVCAAVSPVSSAESEMDGLRQFYVDTPPDEQLGKLLTGLSGSIHALAARCGLPSPDAFASHAFGEWANPASFLGTWRTTKDGRGVVGGTTVRLQRWIAFIRALEPLRAAGLHEARGALKDGLVSADLAIPAFQAGIAGASLLERAHSNGLEDFDESAHRRTIERFLTASARVRAELPRAIPTELIASRRIDASAERGTMGELRRQLRRKRGGMSVRELIDAYAPLILQITPCVLTSPESVARFFSARAGTFDIVVFDEASQIRVADAIGAMGRAKSVVVVGDSKQMPPTSFAEAATDSDDRGEEGTDPVLPDEESILSECVSARVPRQWLSWHYRSQDETLIHFSNHHYYEGRLSSFPAPWAEGERGHGVSTRRVDGQFERSRRGRTFRTNEVEARAIVREIEMRFAVSPEQTPSIGVVTFNAQQRTFIEDLLRDVDDARVQSALDESDGLFVKNLENVQGDERDTILFSIAFSKNSRGVLPLNFGPLTRAGGERRLNVAITRARREVILFRSFDIADLRTESTTSVGVRHLHAYLELAEYGADRHANVFHADNGVDRHRDEIAAALEARGLVVATDVGLSDFRVDLAIAHSDEPAQPVLAILLDGERWRARKTVADRDGVPNEVLTHLMGWPGVERVWLPEWLSDPNAVVERVASALAEAEAAWDSRAESAEMDDVAQESAGGANLTSARLGTTVAGQDAVDEDVRHEAMGERSSGGQFEPIRRSASPVARDADAGRTTFIPWKCRWLGSMENLSALPAPQARTRVESIIGRIVAHEGPIVAHRLAHLVAQEHGLARVRAERASAILACVPAAMTHDSHPDVVWPEDVDPSSWRDVRTADASAPRDIKSIPQAELINAIERQVIRAHGIAVVELCVEVIRMFGIRRRGRIVEETFAQALARAVAEDRVARAADRIQPVS